MMDFLLKAFDLFFGTAKRLAVYLPQSGEDLVRLFQQFLRIARGLMTWLWAHLGGGLQQFLGWLGGYVIIAINFFLELIKNVVARIHW